MHKLNKDFISLSNKERLYNCALPIIALTGGIATGKSTVTQKLKEIGVPVIDADLLVKAIYRKPESIDFIRSLNPELVSSNEINFPKLRKLFFENTVIKQKVEDYIYRNLPIEFHNEYSKLSFKKFNFLIYDVPLLFEKELQNFFDISLLVYANANQQRKRLVIRDKISEDLANKILQQQMNIEEKRDLADFTIKNMSDINGLSKKISNFLQEVSNFSID